MSIGAKNNRLGLLLKQYYDDPSGIRDEMNNRGGSEFSLSKLEKLPTEPLISRAVESLRSYKEAESDLRMLLYNNCDKLLEAVQVVCSIREGSWDLGEQADDVAACAEKINSGTTMQSSAWGAEHSACLRKQSVLALIEELLRFPRWLRRIGGGIEAKLSRYLRVNDLFLSKLGPRYPLVAKLADDCREIVDSELVPVLLNDSAQSKQGSKSRLALLLDLYPAEHAKRRDVLLQFAELETAGLEEALTHKNYFHAKNKDRKSLSLFNAVLNTLFLAHDLCAQELEEKLRDDLVVRASDNIKLHLVEEPEDMCELVEEAVTAHARIPNLSRSGIAQFKKSLLIAYVEYKFRDAAKLFVSEDLPPLLAANAFSSCCDVVHTRCCTALLAVQQCLARCCEDSVSDYMQEIVRVLREYYERCTLVAPGSSPVDLDSLVKLLKMNKSLHTRKTVERSLNALVEIFGLEDNLPEPVLAKIDGVIPHSFSRAVKLIAELPGNSLNLLNSVIQAISLVLEPAHNASTASLAARFNVPTELADTETVHARKLIFASHSTADSSLISLETGVSMILCIFLKNAREAWLGGKGTVVEANPKWKEVISACAAKHIGPPDSELMQPVFAMLKDV